LSLSRNENTASGVEAVKAGKDERFVHVRRL